MFLRWIIIYDCVRSLIISSAGSAASRKQSQSVENDQNKSIGVDSSMAVFGDPVYEEN